MVKATTKEVAKLEFSDLTPAELRSITTAEEAIELLIARGVTPKSISEFGDGFAILTREAKTKLVGVPFFIVGWRQFTSTKYDTDGVAVYVITTDGENRKYTIIDTGSGIKRQLIEDIQEPVGIHVPQGLTRSEYDNGGPNKDIHGVTFYLDETVPA